MELILAVSHERAERGRRRDVAARLVDAVADRDALDQRAGGVVAVDEDDRSIEELGAAHAEVTDHVVRRHPREIEVEDDEVGRAFPEVINRRLAVGKCVQSPAIERRDDLLLQFGCYSDKGPPLRHGVGMITGVR